MYMHVHCTFATAETHLLGVYKPGYFTTPWYKHYQYQVPCPTACAAAASVTEKLYNHARLAEPGCERGPKKCHLPQHTGCVRLIWISWISPSSAHSIIVDFDMDFLDLGNHEILVIHIVERFLGFLGLAISGLCTLVRA